MSFCGSDWIGLDIGFLASPLEYRFAAPKLPKGNVRSVHVSGLARRFGARAVPPSLAERQDEGPGQRDQARPPGRERRHSRAGARTNRCDPRGLKRRPEMRGSRGAESSCRVASLPPPEASPRSSVEVASFVFTLNSSSGFGCEKLEQTRLGSQQQRVSSANKKSRRTSALARTKAPERRRERCRRQRSLKRHRSSTRRHHT